MSEITLYIKDRQLCDSAWSPLGLKARPVFTYGETYQVTVNVPAASPLSAGSYFIALDADFCFDDGAGCCAYATANLSASATAIVFTLDCSTARLRSLVNGQKVLAGAVQLSRQKGTSLECYLMDRIVFSGIVCGTAMTIGEDGFWYVNGISTGVKSGYLQGGTVTGGTLSLEKQDGTFLTYSLTANTSTASGATTAQSITINGVSYNFPSGSGTSDYTQLTNKPSINNVTLSGSMTSASLGLAPASHTHSMADITGLGTELGQKADETAVSEALTLKQNLLSAGANITISGNTISATDTKYTAGTNVIISGNTISATDTKYTAGTNVIISGNTISATDTKYTAGTNITISGGTISADVPVKDVLLGGTSCLASGTASIPVNTAGGVPLLTDSDQLENEQVPIPTFLANGGANGQGGIKIDNRIGGYYGVTIDSEGILKLVAASQSDMNNGTTAAAIKAVTINFFRFGVRATLPLVTTIPSATSAFSLLDATATTNNHSCTYEHTPASVPTYTLPAVTDTTVLHEIILYVDMENISSVAFQNPSGTTISPKAASTPSLSEKWTYLCRYEFGEWQIYGVKTAEASV